MSHMLEQAIVDAKALKEAAFNSAKDALVEKYAPEIKQAVNAILEQEEDDMGLGDEEAGLGDLAGEEGEGGEESNVDLPLAATAGEKLCPCPDEEEEIEIDFDELEKQMQKMDAEDEEEPASQAELATDLNLGGGEEDELALEEELELEESDLLAMLQESSCGDDDKERESMLEEEEEDEEGEEEEGGNKKTSKHDDNPKLKGGQKNLPDALQKGIINSQNESLNLEARIQKAVLSEAKRVESGLLKENKKLQSEKDSLIKENTSLKTKSEEFKSKVLELSETLESVNLNNARLFYTNKVLTSTSLNERQKDKIAEAISRAGSVDEAKTVFDTLVDSVGSSNERRTESLNEVVGNKRTGFVTRQNKTTHPEKNRWQALAGIKK